MTNKQHWANIPEATFITGMRLLFWIYKIFGRGIFPLTLYPVVIFYVIFNPNARTASKNYLNHLGNITPNIFNILKHFISFSESILDKILLWGGLFKFDNTEVYGRKIILNNLEQKKGGLLICSHLGNLELCRVLSKHNKTLKLTVLIHTKHAKAFNQLLSKLDPSSQINLMQVTELTPASAIQLKEKIDHGEFIAITGDRIPVTSHPKVIFAPFLNQNAPFPIGPYILASLLQCPVYLLFSIRTSSGTQLYFEAFRELIQLSRKQRDEILTQLITDYAARLEYYCRKAPLQWFNFYDFWSLSSGK
jgi:predicted LPLAT superfamily acyltransferase